MRNPAIPAGTNQSSELPTPLFQTSLILFPSFFFLPILKKVSLLQWSWLKDYSGGEVQAMALSVL